MRIATVKVSSFFFPNTADIIPSYCSKPLLDSFPISHSLLSLHCRLRKKKNHAVVSRRDEADEKIRIIVLAFRSSLDVLVKSWRSYRVPSTWISATPEVSVDSVSCCRFSFQFFIFFLYRFKSVAPFFDPSSRCSQLTTPVGIS